MLLQPSLVLAIQDCLLLNAQTTPTMKTMVRTKNEEYYNYLTDDSIDPDEMSYEVCPPPPPLECLPNILIMVTL